jgi:hypothetical protein
LKERNDAKKLIAMLWHINIRLYLLYSEGGLQVKLRDYFISLWQNHTGICLLVRDATPGLNNLEKEE